MSIESQSTSAGPVRHSLRSGDRLQWESVERRPYKPTGTHFKDISRQVLFGAEHGLPAQLRYFEIEPGGYSTLERHEHVHAVLILSGRGAALVGEEVTEVTPLALVHVPPMTWHQFRADPDVPLGFLCLVACERDRPQRPGPEELEALLKHPVAGPFIRV